VNRFHSRLGALRGVCPDWAPYTTLNGGCSNVPAGVTDLPLIQGPLPTPAQLLAADQGGWAYSGGKPVWITPQSAQQAASPEQVWQAGSVVPVQISRNGPDARPWAGSTPYTGPSDPFTGAPVTLNSTQREVLNQQGTFDNMAQQERIAAEAERQGAALGLAVECTPTVDSFGSSAVYKTLCRINGSEEVFAGDRLILPGAWQIATTELNRTAAASGGETVSYSGLLTSAAGYGSGQQLRVPGAGLPAAGTPAIAAPAVGGLDDWMSWISANRYWVGGGAAAALLALYWFGRKGRR
jgi:hypothetical protein